MKIDVWTLLLQALNLGVLLLLLRWLFYRPLLNVIDARRRAVADESVRAQAAQQQAEQRAQALEGERAALESSRQALLQAARDQAAQERDALRAQAQRDAERVLDEARQRNEAERREALRSLLDEAGDVAAALAERLLRASPPGGDAGCVAALVERARATPAEEREAWFAADQPRRIDVASAQALEPDARARTEAALRALFGDDVQLQCAPDPALMHGAELRFAHGVLAQHWAGELAAAREALRKGAQPPAPPDPEAPLAPPRAAAEANAP